MAEALYRKYRPQVFEDVVGQEPIERTLKNAIDQDKVSHAYLFCGPRGTGKTTTARLLAKALLCQNGPTPNPDGSCEDCELIAEGAHPDVYELDAASRTGVENVREEIISRVQFAPTRGRSKVYIIDEVHMLSTAAFNALLKTLEEPPSHVVFVLCTTDPQKVPDTIHSRCQRFDFRRIAPESMVSRLGAICMAEGVEFEGEALDLVAQRAEGGLRNALTSLEQIIAFENGSVTLAGAERLLGSIDSSDLAEIMSYVGKRDVASCFKWTAAYVETGADLAQFVRDMSEHVRNLYVMALVGDDAEIDVTETNRHELATELQWYGPDRASRLLAVLGDLSAELKTSSNPRLAFEIALTRMVRPDSDLTIEALAERVEALESGYSAVAHVTSGATGSVATEQLSSSAVTGVPDGLRSEAPQPSLHPSDARISETSQPSPHVSGAPGSETSQPSASPSAFAGAPDELRSETSQASARSSEVEGASQSREQAAAGNLVALSNPATLQRVWQAALAAVKKEKQAHGVLFMNTKARFDADRQQVVVTFPTESTFAFNAVQKPEVQDALAQALLHAVGSDVPFAYEQASSGGAAAHQAGRQTQGGNTRETSAVEGGRRTEAPSEQRGVSESAADGANRSEYEAFAPQGNGRSNDASYEEVPYEEVPYDEVPYEELGFDPGLSSQSADRPSATSSVHPSSEASTANAPEIHGGGSPAAQEDGSADIEAMLQAGFGGGVVISEVDD